MMVDGTVSAFGSELLREIDAPEPVVIPVSLTTPLRLAVEPPTIEPADNDTDKSEAGCIPSTAETDPDPADAEIVAVVALLTAFVLTVNVADVAPAGTSTVAGTTADAEFEIRLTANPADGATPFSFTMPVADEPPPTVVGAMLNADNPAGCTVNDAVLLVPLNVAVNVTVVAEANPSVETENVPVLAPAAIETLPGTEADELLEDKLTTTPPFGAALDRVIVPVALVPAITDDGATETDCRSGV